jgi:hypothetical protein
VSDRFDDIAEAALAAAGGELVHCSGLAWSWLAVPASCVAAISMWLAVHCSGRP